MAVSGKIIEIFLREFGGFWALQKREEGGEDFG